MDWTLSELTEQVAALMSRLPAPSNGQIRPIPDQRNIRYYTTLGLLDRPLLRGRTAFYGPRHAAQIVAIKRLQFTGKSLAQIAEMWPSIDSTMLSRLSGMAVPLGPEVERTSERSEQPAATRARSFWKASARSNAENKPPLAATEPVAASNSPLAATQATITLSLGHGVELSLPVSMAAAIDMTALSVAAQPLLTFVANQLTPKP